MTKTILKTASVAVLATTIFTGCIGGAGQPAKDFSKCYKQGEEVPKWVCKPRMEGALVAVGTGEAGALQEDEAMADGRDKLASQLSIKVSNLMKKFVATTGTGKDQTTDKAMSKVSKQLASETLVGTKKYDMYETSKGTLFILVGMPTNQGDLNKKIDSAVKTSFKNDQAMYQKFLASKASGELDAELEKAGNNE
ncbi:MAG: LPP20 family lipoprotein [Campylobacterota bacterium]|nr:LPP20 family lipoprotein [Campylobacterota bacterium]